MKGQAAYSQDHKDVWKAQERTEGWIKDILCWRLKLLQQDRWRLDDVWAPVSGGLGELCLPEPAWCFFRCVYKLCSRVDGLWHFAASRGGARIDSLWLKSHRLDVESFWFPSTAVWYVASLLNAWNIQYLLSHFRTSFCNYQGSQLFQQLAGQGFRRPAKTNKIRAERQRNEEERRGWTIVLGIRLVTRYLKILTWFYCSSITIWCRTAMLQSIACCHLLFLQCSFFPSLKVL